MARCGIALQLGYIYIYIITQRALRARFVLAIAVTVDIGTLFCDGLDICVRRLVMGKRSSHGSLLMFF